MNILLYADIPGLPEYVLLTRKAVTVPAIGDRLRINADRLACKFSRQVLEETPACQCFERNERTESMSVGDFLKECELAVSRREWSYDGGTPCCTLDVEVVEW